MKAEDVLGETWAADDANPERVMIDDEAMRYIRIADFGWTEDGPARARIAACAPEALRLLLEAEYTSDEHDANPKEFCPWCRNRTELPPDGNPGVPMRQHPGEHAPDCLWLALMRKAGLR